MRAMVRRYPPGACQARDSDTPCCLRFSGVQPGADALPLLQVTRHACGRHIEKREWVFRTNVTADFGIVTEDFGPS